MQQLIQWSGNTAAVVGVLCCIVAVLARLSGAYYIAGNTEAMSVFSLGVGLMVFACLAKLELLLQQGKG
tara:strand:+ start:569 stop:775 length:207 start_codon:yes stop_codon:yes gene_type:complete